MKTRTLILSLTICALCFVVDGFRNSKDESGSGRFGREYDDGNRSALSQKSGSERSRLNNRAGKINDFDDEKINVPEGSPPDRDSEEDIEDSPPEMGPPGRGPPGRGHHKKCPGRGPPNFDDDDNGNDDDKPSNYGRGPPRRGSFRRGPPSFNDDDESGNYGRGPQRRGPPRRGSPSFNDDDESGNYGRGPQRRGPPRRGPPNFDNENYGNDDDKTGNYGDGHKKNCFWQRPSDSSDGKTDNLMNKK